MRLGIAILLYLFAGFLFVVSINMKTLKAYISQITVVHIMDEQVYTIWLKKRFCILFFNYLTGRCCNSKNNNAILVIRRVLITGLSNNQLNESCCTKIGQTLGK